MARATRPGAPWATKESEDVLAAVNYLREVHGLQQVGLMGFSMGAVASVLAAEQDPSIKALLLEAPFSNLDELLAQVAWRDYWLPRYPLLPVVRLIFYVVQGFRLAPWM